MKVKVKVSKGEMLNVLKDVIDVGKSPDVFVLTGEVIEEDKVNGACYIERHEKCPKETDGYVCSCDCHKKVEEEKRCNCNSFKGFDEATWYCDIHGLEEKGKSLPSLPKILKHVDMASTEVLAEDINAIIRYLEARDGQK